MDTFETHAVGTMIAEAQPPDDHLTECVMLAPELLMPEVGKAGDVTSEPRSRPAEAVPVVVEMGERCGDVGLARSQRVRESRA